MNGNLDEHLLNRIQDLEARVPSRAKILEGIVPVEKLLETYLHTREGKSRSYEQFCEWLRLGVKDDVLISHNSAKLLTDALVLISTRTQEFPHLEEAMRVAAYINSCDLR